MAKQTKRYRRFRRKAQNFITRKSVKKIILNEKDSRDHKVSVDKTLGALEYTYVKTLSPDYQETGRTTLKSLDLGLLVPQDNVYRVIVWQQNTVMNRNQDSSNWVTSRNVINNVLDIDITSSASTPAVQRDIISPWDTFNSAKTVKVLYDKIVLQDANGNGSPHIQRIHIPGKKFKPMMAAPYQEATANVGTVLIAILSTTVSPQIMIESRMQYSV